MKQITALFLISTTLFAQMGQQKMRPHVYKDNVRWQIDITTGQTNWLDVYNDTIIVLESGSNLYVLDTAGNLKRTCTGAVSGPGYDVYISKPGIAYISDGGANAVRKYNYRTCTSVWNYTGLAGDVQKIIVEPSNNAVYAIEGSGATDGGIVKLDTSGSFKWRYDPSEANSSVGNFAKYNDTIYFTMANRYNYKLRTVSSATAPTKVWHYQRPSYVTINVSYGSYGLYNFVSGASGLISKMYDNVNNSNGTVNWSRHQGIYQQLLYSNQAVWEYSGEIWTSGTHIVSGSNVVGFQKLYPDPRKGVETFIDLQSLGTGKVVRCMKVYNGWIYATITGGVVIKTRSRQ
jgi:hypothetical protein